MNAMVMQAPAPPLAEEVEPVYEGYMRVIDYSVRARGGMTAKLGLLCEDRVHPFKGLKTGGQGAGQRLRLVLSVTDVHANDLHLYGGEALLAWWAEDCKVGMSMTVRFDDGPDGARHHPLEGRQPGETLYVACWAVSEDETLQDGNGAKRTSRPFNQMGAAQQSQIKCRMDPEFRDWCQSTVAGRLAPEARDALPPFRDDPKEYAAAVVRAYCEIPSRSAFAEDTAQGLAARNRWANLLRRYEDYRRR